MPNALVGAQEQPGAGDACDVAWVAALSPAVGGEVRAALAAYGGRLVRWPLDRATPIRVWVQPVPQGAGSGPPPASSPGASPESFAVLPAAWAWAAGAGARDWDGVVRGLRVAPARDSAVAEVHVTWERVGGDHPGRAAEATHGHTAVLASRAGVIEGADVVLGVPRATARATSADVRAVAAHEFGHVLGLVHQTGARSAMMAGVRADGPSARDRAVLRAWYALPDAAACR